MMVQTIVFMGICNARKAIDKIEIPRKLCHHKM